MISTVKNFLVHYAGMLALCLIAFTVHSCSSSDDDSGSEYYGYTKGDIALQTLSGSWGIVENSYTNASGTHKDEYLTSEANHTIEIDGSGRFYTKFYYGKKWKNEYTGQFDASPEGAITATCDSSQVTSMNVDYSGINNGKLVITYKISDKDVNAGTYRITYEKAIDDAFSSRKPSYSGEGELYDDREVNSAVFEHPRKYSFVKVKAVKVSSKAKGNDDADEKIENIDIYTNGVGFFAANSGELDNKYHLLTTGQSENIATFRTGDIWARWSDSWWKSTNNNGDDFDCIIISDDFYVRKMSVSAISGLTYDSDGSTTQYVTITFYTGSKGLYDAMFYSNVSWIYETGRNIWYDGDNAKVISLSWKLSKNYGSDREGTFYISVPDLEGHDYLYSVDVKQRGRSGGSSGGSSGGGSGSGGDSDYGGGGTGKTRCSICHGTGRCTATNCLHGKCARCAGTGIAPGGGRCYYCDYGYCRTCGGTGDCKYCDGTGYR